MTENKMCYSVLLILLSVYILPANAASPVTYTCCKNSTTDYGTVLDSMDALTGWSGISSATLSLNTTTFEEGTGAITVKTAAGQVNGGMDKVVNYDLSTAKSINYWVYIENTTNTSYTTLYLSNDGTFTNYLSDSWTINQGWNHIVIDPFSMLRTGTGTFASPITKMRFRVNSIDLNHITNATFDAFSINYASTKPKAIITFDDGRDSVYSVVKPIMDANNQRGVSYVITGFVGTSTGGFNYMPKTQLDALYDEGWDISSHTVNHVHLDQVSGATVSSELNDSQDWLNSNGYTRSSRFIAYPYGGYTAPILNNVSLRYVLGRTVKDGRAMANFNLSEGDTVPYTARIVEGQSTTLQETIINNINYTINRSGLIVLLFHNVTHEPTLADSIDFNASNFTNISNYLASRSADIDVITWYDYINVNAPNNTLVVSKTVNINATTGLSEVVVNNPLINDVTADMYVFPSTGYVNVTLSSCSGNRVIWTEQSNTHAVSTHHVTNGCGFPTNSLVALSIDGNSPVYYMTNSTGWVTFDYNGTFSTHSFSLLSSSVGVPQNTIDTTNNIFGASDIIAIISIIVVLIIIGLAAIKLAESGGITELLPLVLVGIVVIAIVVFVVAYVLAPFLGAKI